MKESEATRLARMLKAAYPRQVIEPDTAALYAAFLSDLDRDVGEQAVRTAIATLKFFPTVAELRELATAQRASLPNATSAWAEVVKQVGRIGRYRSPSFTHPAIARVVDALGWVTICDSENVEATRAHFLRLYADTSASVMHETNVRPMLEAAAERREQLRSGEAKPMAALIANRSGS